MGDPEAARKRLDILKNLTLLEYSEAIETVALDLVASGLVPEKCAADALHVAYATVHGMDILLTWNCTHLANAFVMREMAKKIRELGYEAPVICTPEEMLGDEDA